VSAARLDEVILHRVKETDRMTSMTNPGSTGQAFAGVDTHKASHQVAVINQDGGVLAQRRFDTTGAACAQVRAWLSRWPIARVGIEQTGTYGAELTRVLTSSGFTVVEVDRPDVWTRARAGKSDPLDAVAAAQAARTGRATTVPKDSCGIVAAIARLHSVRRSAIKARAAALTQINAEAVTVPAALRERLGTTSRQITTASLRLRPDPARLHEPAQAAKLGLRRLAERITALDTEIADLDRALDHLTRQAAPRLRQRPGVGAAIAAQLLITTGQNIDRISTDAKFARLTGIAPIPASSGQTHRMRLHRGGDRAANSAIHLVAIGRLRYHQPAIDYLHRRTQQGLSKKDTIRAMKRHIARELFGALKADLQALDPT
jgi:transposase